MKKQIFKFYYLHGFVATAFLLFIAGCGPNESQHSTIKEWIKLDNSLFGNLNPSFHIAPIISHDKKWLYLSTQAYGGNIVALDIGNDFAKSVQDKSKWSKISWQEPSFTGNVGMARFTDKGYILTLNAAAEGLLVAWSDSLRTNKNGALYVKGNKLQTAWATTNTHILGVPVNHEITNFFAINKNGIDVPYIVSSVSSSNFGVSKLYTRPTLKRGSILTASGSRSANNFSMAKFAQSEDVAFLVYRDGISTLNVSDAGTTTPFSNTSNMHSDEWNMGDPMTKNFNVNCILVSKQKKLFIGLGAPHDFQGGVAIYDPKTDTIIAPKKSIWNRVNVRHLFMNDTGEVFAVTAKEIIEVKPDGSMGEKLNASIVKANQVGNPNAMAYKGEMPDDDLFSAIYVGNTLFLLSNNQAYLMVTKNK